MFRSAYVVQHYTKTATMAATSNVGDSPLFAIEYVLRIARVLVLLSIWRAILSGRGAVSGLTLGAVLTYTLISEVFAEQLASRTQLDDALWQGSIATRLLQPMSMVGQFAADMIGRWGFGLVFFSLPLYLCAPLLSIDPRPASPAAGLCFIASLVLSVSVGLAIEFIFGGLVVALAESVWLVVRLRWAINAVLSGSLLPLALLPWGLGNLFQWLPFASTASAPLRVYTGTGNPLILLPVQALWSALLWPLARWIWAANREKLVGYGG